MTHESPNSPEMLDCKGAMERLFDFLDGELGPDLEMRVRAHLAACGHCFEEAGFEKRFLGALRTARGSENCPEALRKRVLDMLRTEGWSEATGS